MSTNAITASALETKMLCCY